MGESWSSKVKHLLGIKPVDVKELNIRTTNTKKQQKVNRIHQIPADIIITEEYKTVRDLLAAECPVVFVTGNAGTGKSTLIRYLRSIIDKKSVVVAPTGVAALNVNGVTIHSFFRFPPKIHEEEDIKLVYDRKLYQKLELLIIDEISMVRADLMDSIDKFLRKNRSNDKPFGGVQLLLIGDLFQLPPVTTNQESGVLQARGYSSPYFFSSFSLQRTSLVPIELTSFYRQEDSSFISLLNQIRIGENLQQVIPEINHKCMQQQNRKYIITLTCTNDRADHINMRELKNLPTKEYSFKGTFKGKFSLEHDKLPSPLDLRLKKGAHVMFTKNDEQHRWVNGSIGIVNEVDSENIRVELFSGNRDLCHVLPVKWENYKYSYDPMKDSITSDKIGEYIQYPLMLAWAVTIHKSQGKSLDNVLVDLGNGAFASGQVYVALSRCRSIDNITLAQPIRETDVKCDPIIRGFYHNLAAMIEETESEL